MNAPIVLSAEQRYIMLQFNAGHNLFVTGQAGTGKTQVIKAMIASAIKRGIVYKVCAMTGCAAVLLGSGASTLHSFAGIGLCSGDADSIIKSSIKKRSKINIIRSCSILIIDEVSMMSKKIFEIVEQIMRIARSNSLPFGGIQVIFTGDFMQLPPIRTYGDDDTALFCFESPLWNKIFDHEYQMEMKTVFRQEDPVYRNILTETRNGELSEESIGILENRMKMVYNPEEHNDCIPTKIFPLRASVDHMNRVQYNKLISPEFTVDAVNRTDCTLYLDSNSAIPRAMIISDNKLTGEQRGYELKRLLDSSNLLNVMRFKVGTIVMCTANLDMENGICNGAQGIIIATSLTLTGSVPVVKFHNGIIRVMNVHHTQSTEYPTLAVFQIPLIHAWAISIHKCQGVTLDIAEMDIGSNIFEEGQTYVALSRVKSLEGLYLSNLDPSRIRVNPRVCVFYAELTPMSTLMHTDVVEEDVVKESAVEEIDSEIRRIVVPFCK